jgi:hypothetical protein
MTDQLTMLALGVITALLLSALMSLPQGCHL